MPQLSHIIFYIKDIPKAVIFYEQAFGITQKFMHESGLYVELNTGATSLAFAAESLGKANLPQGFEALKPKGLPQAGEIVFTDPDVQSRYNKAISAGAQSVAAPTQKPWGQTVAYVKDLNGVLIEIASPIE